MTREEIEQKIKNNKWCIENWKASRDIASESIKDLTEEIKDLEKQLKEMEVEVYEPMFIDKIPSKVIFTEEQLDKNIKIERHNAGEELKKLISEENQRQGWKVDWDNDEQWKFYLYLDHEDKEVRVGNDNDCQELDNEFYFSNKSSQDKDFLDKIKPLWLKWKGIE